MTQPLLKSNVRLGSQQWMGQMLFEYSLLHWTTFLSAALLLNLSLGPDFAFILAQTAKGSRKQGFVAMFGIWTGALSHVLMATNGLSAILTTSAIAFTIVKWQGVLIATLNPKVGIFFLSFLPQFVVDGSGPVAAQLFLHGVLIIAVAAIIEPVLVIVGDNVSNGLKSNKTFSFWSQRLLGTIFIALGIKLARSTQ